MKKLIVLVSLLVALPCVASFDNNLYYGIQGSSEVTELQEFLTSESVYSGPITGNFFSLTLNGVKAFQARENISPVAGYFGPLTRTRANEILSVDLEASDEQAKLENQTTSTPTAPKTTDDVIDTLQAAINAIMQQIALLTEQLSSQKSLEEKVEQQTQIIQQQQETIEQIQQDTQQIAENTIPQPNPEPKPEPEPISEVKKELIIKPSGHNIYVYYLENGVEKSNDAITISSDDDGVFIGQGPEYSCSGGEAANSSGSQRKGNPLTCSTSKFLGNAPFSYSPSAIGTRTITATANGVSATTTIGGK